MVPLAEVPTHQQPGTVGGSPCTPALSPPGHQQGRDSDDRQHHSRWPDQESGQHPLTILVPPDCSPSQVGGQRTHYIGPSPHPRTSECGGWLPLPETPDHQLGVDTVSPRTPPHVAPLGPAPCRSLCHVGECPLAHVHLTTPRPGSVEDWHLVLSVDGSVGLHIPTFPPHPRSPPADTDVPLPSHSDSNSLAVSTLVSSPTVSSGRPPETPASPFGCSCTNHSLRSSTRIRNASSCMPGGNQVGPYQPRLFLAGGSLH